MKEPNPEHKFLKYKDKQISAIFTFPPTTQDNKINEISQKDITFIQSHISRNNQTFPETFKLSKLKCILDSLTSFLYKSSQGDTLDITVAKDNREHQSNSVEIRSHLTTRPIFFSPYHYTYLIHPNTFQQGVNYMLYRDVNRKIENDIIISSGYNYNKGKSKYSICNSSSFLDSTFEVLAKLETSKIKERVTKGLKIDYIYNIGKRLNGFKSYLPYDIIHHLGIQTYNRFSEPENKMKSNSGFRLKLFYEYNKMKDGGSFITNIYMNVSSSVNSYKAKDGKQFKHKAFLRSISRMKYFNNQVNVELKSTGMNGCDALVQDKIYFGNILPNGKEDYDIICSPYTVIKYRKSGVKDKDESKQGISSGIGISLISPGFACEWRGSGSNISFNIGVD